jgi:hypothetical protein
MKLSIFQRNLLLPSVGLGWRQQVSPSYQTTRQSHTQEDHYPSSHCHENLKSLISAFLIQDVMTVEKQDGSVAKRFCDLHLIPVMDSHISLRHHLPSKSGAHSSPLAIRYQWLFP